MSAVKKRLMNVFGAKIFNPNLFHVTDYAQSRPYVDTSSISPRTNNEISMLFKEKSFAKRSEL